MTWSATDVETVYVPGQETIFQTQQHLLLKSEEASVAGSRPMISRAAHSKCSTLGGYKQNGKPKYTIDSAFGTAL